jgi:lipopolysaccharide export system protein LptA
VAILAIVGSVATSYYLQKKSLAREAPQAPAALPTHVDAAATDWVWNHIVGGRPVVEVRAKDFRQVKDRMELERVELRIYHDDGKVFDRVKSARAEFDTNQGSLYSDGEVEITMGVPVEGSPGRLVMIRTSGATFDSKTGKASTERLAAFTFDRSHGQSVGAAYDPSTRELHMGSQVELHWGAGSRPMKLEAGELIYKERESLVLLFPWSRLTRESTTLEAADSLVTLDQGVIQKVEAKKARGTDRYPARQLEYSAEFLTMKFAPNGEVEKITGERNARLVSVSAAARTTMNTDRVDLEFELSSGESTLTKALAMGNSSLESVPLPRVTPAPMSRVLKSEVVLVHMRPGGREVDRVETETPGRLEFLPNRPGQRKRTMDAERMSIVYGDANQIRHFRAAKAATRTEPEPRKGAAPAPPLQTWSDELSADFDPKTGQLAKLEQWSNFRFEEGDRKGRADRATLEEGRNLIALEKQARVWDPSGSTAGDRILLDQRTGDVTAEGSVVSTRIPDRKGGSSAMLSGEQSLEARAQRMTTASRNQLIRYEGDAVVWQGANRIRAGRVEIDRAARRLTAQENVRTQFVDRPKPGDKRQGAPAFIAVDAASLVYTEHDRMAHYTGGAHLSKPGMDVNAAEIRAFFKETGGDSSLDRAIADGKVEIVQRDPDRTRTGTAEHAEYYVAEAKIVLEGGGPALEDTLRGSTRGTQLTYFANDDKLLVNGAEQQPVVSRIRRQADKSGGSRITRR